MIKADTVESGEAVVGVDGHGSDNHERVVFRDLGLHLKGLAAKVRGTFSLSKTNTRRIQPWRSETCPTTYLNLDTMAKLFMKMVVANSNNPYCEAMLRSFSASAETVIPLLRASVASASDIGVNVLEIHPLS